MMGLNLVMIWQKSCDREGKRRLKHSHKVFEEQGGFDILLSISLLTTLIQLE